MSKKTIIGIIVAVVTVTAISLFLVLTLNKGATAASPGKLDLNKQETTEFYSDPDMIMGVVEEYLKDVPVKPQGSFVDCKIVLGYMEKDESSSLPVIQNNKAALINGIKTLIAKYSRSELSSSKALEQEKIDLINQFNNAYGKMALVQIFITVIE